MALISAEYVEDQSLVCVGKTNVSVPISVRQIQLALQGFKGHSWLLRHGLDVHCLVWLKPNDELVTTALPTKDVPGNVTELDTNFGLSLVQSYKKTKISSIIERNTSG